MSYIAFMIMCCILALITAFAVHVHFRANKGKITRRQAITGYVGIFVWFALLVRLAPMAEWLFMAGIGLSLGTAYNVALFVSIDRFLSTGDGKLPRIHHRPL